MRFQVTKVMDAIEQRLTTDITCAQAVVDLGEVVRRVDLDGGRPVNLVRIGMVVDALSRYLIDEGAMLYPVAERSLLSEAAFTAKERMVLSRWADDGLIEVVAQAKDRAAEVADLTGLPLITLDAGSVPSRFGWPDGGAGRVLLLAPRSGAAVLTPLPEPEPPPEGARAVGRAPVRRSASPAEGNGAPPTDDASGEGSTQTGGGQAAPAGEPRSSDEPASEQNPGEQRASEQRASEQPAGEQHAGEQHAGEQPPGAVSEESAGEESAGGEPAGEEKPSQAATPGGDGARAAGEPVPLPVAVFTGRSATRDARVRISRHRFLRAEPNPARSSLLARQWRCDSMDCPAFGEHRQIGQPAPALRGDTPVCPRHDQPLTDAGPRPVAYPVSIVVDDLPRHRLVVREGQPVVIGKAEGDPAVFSVAPWLHRAAKNWISPSHVELVAGPDGLRVTDLSARGTVVWRRTGPDSRRQAEHLHRDTRTVGEWDSVELYTGIEVARGDHQLATVLGSQAPASVLMDAPTAAHRTVAAGQAGPVGKAQPAGSRAGSS